MDLIIITTPQPKWVKIEFSELYNGYNSVNVRAEQLTGVWCGDERLGVSITDGKLWDVSYDDNAENKILSVDGNVPASNEELCEMLMALNNT